MAGANSSVFHPHFCAEHLKDVVMICSNGLFSDSVLDVDLDTSYSHNCSLSEEVPVIFRAEEVFDVVLAEEVLVAVLAEEVLGVFLAEEVLVIVLTGEGPGVVLAKEVLTFSLTSSLVLLPRPRGL